MSNQVRAITNSVSKMRVSVDGGTLEDTFICLECRHHHGRIGAQSQELHECHLSDPYSISPIKFKVVDCSDFRAADTFKNTDPDEYMQTAWIIKRTEEGTKAFLPPSLCSKHNLDFINSRANFEVTDREVRMETSEYLAKIAKEDAVSV